MGLLYLRELEVLQRFFSTLIQRVWSGRLGGRQYLRIIICCLLVRLSNYASVGGRPTDVVTISPLPQTVLLFITSLAGVYLTVPLGMAFFPLALASLSPALLAMQQVCLLLVFAARAKEAGGVSTAPTSRRTKQTDWFITH